MKKNKKILILSVIALVVVLLIVLVVIFSLRNIKIKRTVKEMYASLQSGNVKEIQNYITSDVINGMKTEGETNESEELKIFFEELKIDVKSIKIKSNEAVVTMKVSNKDIKETLKSYFSTAFAQMLKNITTAVQTQELEGKLTEYLKEEYAEASKVENEITVKFVKENNRWVVEKSEENTRTLLNGILPGYLEYINISE